MIHKCQKCGSSWILRPGDSYCPLCGALIPFLQVDLLGDPILYADYPAKVGFQVSVTNIHPTAQMKVLGVDSNPPCVTRGDGPGPITLAPGRQTTLQLNYSGAGLPKEGVPWSGNVSIFVQIDPGDGNARRVRVVKPVYDAPDASGPNATVVLSGASSGNVVKGVNLGLNATAKSFFLGATYDTGFYSLPPGAVDPATGSVDVEFDGAKIDPGTFSTCTMKIRVKDHPDLTVGFSLFRSPLAFGDPTLTTVFVGQDGWAGLPFRNVTQQTFPITSAVVTGMRLNGAAAAPLDTVGLAFLALENLPMMIAPGQERAGYDFRVRMDGRTLQPGAHEIDVRFDLGPPIAASVFETFAFGVTNPVVSTDVLGLDFGTSNSCAAMFDAATNQSRTLCALPTRMALTPRGEILIGQDAGRDPSREAPPALKLYLGRRDVLLDGNTARDLAFLYIRELLWRAERAAGRRFQNVVVTHPSRFTNRQLDDYREIVSRLEEECGVNVRMIDEAASAAFATIGNPPDQADDTAKAVQKLAGAGRFTLFVFDCGGGTTDMTLCERDVPGNCLRPLNSGGKRRFGGRHIDALTAGIVADQVKDAVVLSLGVARNTVWAPVSRDELDEPPRNLGAGILGNLRTRIDERLNVFELQKIELCLGNTQIRLDLGLPVYVNGAERDNGAGEWAGKQYEMTPEEFRKRLAVKVDDALSAMRRILKEAGIKEPDLIILAGGSANVPLIESMMKGAFPLSHVGKARDLKECVAKGAAFYGYLRDLAGANALKIIGFGETTRSAFGYKSYQDGRFVFCPVVTKGEDLPQSNRNIPLLAGRVKIGTVFEIYESFGQGDDFIALARDDDLEPIRSFQIDKELVNGFEPHELARAEALMTVECDESIVLTLKADDKTVEIPVQ